MTTKFFAAFAAAMMTVATISANNNNEPSKGSNPDDNVLPGVTVVASANQKTIEVFSADCSKRFEYNLDAQGRVSSKVNYIGSKKGWTPYAAYSVFYGEEETVLSYAEYNPTTKTFTSNPKQVRYDAKAFPEIIRVPQSF